MIDVKQTVLAREKALKKAGVSVAAVLKAAGVDRSTWTYWKSGTQPRLDNWLRVEAQIAEALANPEAFATKRSAA